MVNEANWERVARVVLGVALAIVGFVILDGTAGVVVGVLAFVPILTGLSGWCPLYSLFGFRTNKPDDEAAAS